VGDIYVKRVASLYKMRAFGAQKQWSHLEAAFVDDLTLEQAVIDARLQTKTLAREWLEYARSAGKDTVAARTLCVSAAGTEDFCAE
jgi:hypothetical protein